MARPGITYLDVASAATQLMEKNIRPSIEGVRRILGTGSNSTINRHLRDWRNKQGKHIELEQGLPESLLIAVKGIYKTINEEAAEKIMSAQETCNTKMGSLESQLTAAAQKNQQLGRDKQAMAQICEQRQIGNQALQKNRNDLQSNLDKKVNENEFMRDRLKEAKADIDRLSKQLTHSQDSVNHYRESVRLERESERNKLEKKISRLKSELQKQQNSIPTLKEEVLILSYQVKSLKEDRQVSMDKLDRSIHDGNNQAAKCEAERTKRTALQEQLRILEIKNKQLKEEAEANKAQIMTLKVKFAQSERQIEALNSTTKKLEDNLSHFTNKALFLTQEKTELAMQLSQLRETAD